MSEHWWQSWSIAMLSPLNPLAVVAAQLDPPDLEEVWTHSQHSHRMTQLFWLCWHARPDLREQMLGNSVIPVYRADAVSVGIHPETIAEWSEPPQWSDARLLEREWSIRRTMLFSVPLTMEQCQSIHPDTWTPVSLGFQAAQSEAHGQVLLTPIHLLDAAALERCLVEYVSRMGATLCQK